MDIVVGLLIAVVSIIVGVLIANITMKHDRQLAEESGSLRKPEIELAIFDCKIGKGYPDNENWFLIHPGKLRDYAAFPIKLTIYNSGDAKTDEILILIRIPSYIFWKDQYKGIGFSIHPSLAIDNIKKSIDDLGEFTLISFALPPLSPKSTIDITLPFSFESTLLDISSAIQLKDAAGTARVKVLYQNTISMTILSGNDIPKVYMVKMGAMPAIDLADGIQRFSTLLKQSPPFEKHIKEKIFDLFKDLFGFNDIDFNVTNFISFEIESITQLEGYQVIIMKEPANYYRRGWINNISRDIKELANLKAGHIVGVVNYKKIPKSQRKFRFKEGNLIQ